MPLQTFVEPKGITSVLELARVIDHTLLKADATHDAIAALCDAAMTHHFYAVCVNSHWIKLCANRLKNSQVLPITVVGFPLGATTTAAKVFETQDAIQNGAQEIDMVLNIGALKSNDPKTVANDIKAVVLAAVEIPVKVILETSLLTDEQKKTACLLSVEAGARYVKTSTGFSGTGANVHDISLMRETVGKNIGVKASGGIRTLQDALGLIQAGASRIGASASVEILKAFGATA